MMKKAIVAVVVVTCFLLNGIVLWASECFEIDKLLRLELEKDFSQYSVVQYSEFSEQEKQQFVQTVKDSCPYAITLASSVLVVLLKDKQSDLYMLVQAELSSSGASKKWNVIEVEAFSNEIPLIEKARAGFYTDMVKNKKVTITRHSIAFLVTLYKTGKQYIFKKNRTAGFDRFQIQ